MVDWQAGVSADSPASLHEAIDGIGAPAPAPAPEPEPALEPEAAAPVAAEPEADPFGSETEPGASGG